MNNLLSKFHQHMPGDKSNSSYKEYLILRT